MKAFLIFIILFLASCQTYHRSPVEVGEAYPRGRYCESIGQVIGMAGKKKNAEAQSIEDLKENAARLGGNYVRVIAVSAYGTAARGIAYKCRVKR